jgi:hypothetical protein
MIMYMNIVDEVQKLNLPPNSFVVVGSGILGALNIRKSDDIDLIVSDDVFDHLQAQGWQEEGWADQKVLKRGVFDVGRTWSGKTVDELLKTSIIIHGIPFLSLYDLREWKQEQARQKDLQDIILIDEYLKLKS